VRASYDAVAAQYAARLGDELSHKALDRGLLRAFLDLAGTGPIADLGCGPGHITRYLAARRPDVTGIDVSPHMIDICSRGSAGGHLHRRIAARPARC
jgi:trans-aconitate methyltransferase